MAMSRAFGGTRLTTRSPMRISPEVMFSSPAIIRSSVDLPHPDGPTSTTNSPSAISTFTSWITWIEPKAFLTLRMVTDAIISSPALHEGGAFEQHVPHQRSGIARDRLQGPDWIEICKIG